jgi:hypothetical protein
MAQNDFGTIDPNTKSGTALATDLNNFRDAQNTNNSGSSQPSYIQTYGTWIDSTAANVIFKLFDGTDDIPLYVADVTNNVARVALDFDRDTYIVSSTDDQMDFYSSTSVRMSLTASLLTMSVPIDMNGNAIQFDDATGINDANGNELLIFQTTASAVNQIEVTNGATATGPSLDATGDDTNINLLLGAKGTGGIVPTAGAKATSNNLGNLSTSTTLHIYEGNIQHGTMTGSFTLTAPDDTESGYIELELTIDSTGGYTLTLSGFNEVTGTVSTGADVVNVLRISKMNTNTYLEVIQAV